MATEKQNGISSWCTKKFLENALQQGLGNPDINVVSFEIGKATASGDNYLSDMYRVALMTKENGRDNNISLVIKCSPQDENTKQFVSELDLYRREFEALKVTLPQFHGLLEEIAPGKYQPFAATCLYHQNVENRTVIVLDDLKAQGFKMAERRLGLDLEHCVLVMRMLARLHGSSVGLYERDPGFFEIFRNKPGGEKNEERIDNLFSQSIMSLADEIDTWEDVKEFAQYSERLRKYASHCQNKIKELDRNDEEFNVLTHGDCWVNNIMFRYNDQNQPKDVRFVDLQLSYWSSPAMDILYFLHTSPNMDIYNKHQFLLEEYHNELGKTLQVFNLKHLQPSFQELQQMLNQKYCFALFASVVALPFVLRDPDNALNVDEIFKNEGKSDVAEQKFHKGVELKRAYITFLPTFAEKGVI